MPRNTYTVKSERSWGSKVGGSFKGMVVALVLFVAFTIELYWNEGRTVRTSGAINEARSVCVEMKDIAAQPSQYEGKLVHAIGKAETQNVLEDGNFGIKTPGPAVMMSREVQYYQWVETSKTEKKKKLGGGEETVTTYYYNTEWVRHPVDSMQFREYGDANVPFPHRNFVRAEVENLDVVAPDVSFGAYKLNDGQKRSIGGAQPMKVVIPAEKLAELNAKYTPASEKEKDSVPPAQAVQPASPDQTVQPVSSDQAVQPASADQTVQPASPDQTVQPVPSDQAVQTASADKTAAAEAAPSYVHASGNVLYIGRNPGMAAVGDVRITYKVTLPTTISLIARVVNNTFEPYIASNGESFSWLSTGSFSLDKMISDAHSSNNVTAWVLRGVGALMIIVAIALFLAPISAVADVLPILGDIASAGTVLVAMLLGLAWSLVVIAVAWLRFRPVYAWSAIGVAVLLTALVIYRGHRKKAA
ncbi:MAG: TMEM43 family protein [Pyramidobacter sp.]